jgi:hypothetical protein
MSIPLQQVIDLKQFIESHNETFTSFLKLLDKKAMTA